MNLDRSYIPHANYPYPEFTDQHYMKITSDDGTVFDKDYPYIDKSKKFKRKQRWTRFLLYLIVFPMSYVRMGLRIRGRKNIRKYKSILKEGVISIANHVNRWDYIAVMNAIRPFKSYVLVWNKNVSDKDGKLVRAVGGIPIPDKDYQANIAYIRDVNDLLKSGGWLHIYPEGSMWEYYRYVRPFKKGIAHLARANDKPILPLGFSYRKASWIRRKLFKQPAVFNLCIGEPLFINKNLPPEQQEEDLMIRCHKAVCSLAGLAEGDNPYSPIFDNSKKIDI